MAQKLQERPVSNERIIPKVTSSGAPIISLDHVRHGITGPLPKPINLRSSLILIEKRRD